MVPINYARSLMSQFQVPTLLGKRKIRNEVNLPDDCLLATNRSFRMYSKSLDQTIYMFLLFLDTNYSI